MTKRKLRVVPVQRRAARTLRAIEEAILEALYRHGRDRMTTQHVADSAGVSIGTLYRYFPNRVALLDHVWPDRGAHMPVPDAAERAEVMRPEVVTLCGSTRFYETFRLQNLRLTLEGRIVLSIGYDGKSDADLEAAGMLGEVPDKAALDELHKRKIDLSDRIFVLNVGGYIGQSTYGEIEYAWSQHKRITYLEQRQCSCDDGNRHPIELPCGWGDHTTGSGHWVSGDCWCGQDVASPPRQIGLDMSFNPEIHQLVKVTAADFDMQWDADHLFPFFEDENGDHIIGYGLQDRAKFAALVNEYDALANGGASDVEYDSGDVVYIYALAYAPLGTKASEEWRVTWDQVRDTTEGAFPLTVVHR